MSRQYIIGMFFLCFFAWVILVDNAVLPSNAQLRQDVGQYSHYRIKKWSRGKLDFVSDQLLVYAVVENREQLYYMEYQPHFEATLNAMPEYTPVQMRYVRRFPKFWKRELYDMRIEGRSTMSYSAYYLLQKQKDIWKITGILVGIFLFLAALGFINKPRAK